MRRRNGLSFAHASLISQVPGRERNCQRRFGKRESALSVHACALTSARHNPRVERDAMPARPPTILACALAIGGLDPGGGAGIAADLRAFAAAGAFGCAAAAVLTVQSTAGLRAVRAVPAREVTAQAAEVMRHQRVRAVKVGALG